MQVAHASNLEKLSADKENLSLAVNEEQRIVSEKTQDITRIAQDTLALKEETTHIALTERMTESRTSYALSLYSKISNISWDYTATASGDRLAGCEYGNHLPSYTHTLTHKRIYTLIFNDILHVLILTDSHDVYSPLTSIPLVSHFVSILLFV
jgi:hypothetical protein